ncbi:MAG: tetratricopeptide repeat protein [Bacteroidales bacterium]|nr:tetratricopeptide repeat protein [Bacteroidales bacterium]
MPGKPPDLFRFWEELKRRKVVKAAFVYIAVAWAILEASDTIFPLLELPDWTIKFVLILLIIVFILIIVLTWIYDITPEGIKVTDRVDAEGRESGSRGGKDARKRLGKAKSPGLQRYTVFRKIILPILIVTPLLLILIFKQRFTEIIGIEDPKRVAARSHVNNAKLSFQAGDLAGASGELELALASDPKYSYAWSSLAALSVARGDLNKAVLQTIEAVKFDPKNFEAAYNMAIALDDKKDYHQAIRWYSEAIRIDSSFVPAYSALGRVYNQLSQPVDAVLILTRAIEKSPESEYLYLVYKNLGNSHLMMDQYDEAVRYLELSWGLKPDMPETCLFLAKAYEASGKITRGIELWQNYIGLETDTAKTGPASRHLKEITIRHLQSIIE